MPEQVFSSRTQNLDRASQIIDGIDGVSIPQYVEIPYTSFNVVEAFPDEALRDIVRPDFSKPPLEAVDHYLLQLQEKGIVDRIRGYVSPILDMAPIIIRCAPVVSSDYSHLSFAGTYPSFVPKPFPQNMEAVDVAVASVLAGKHTRYADYYTHRHGVPSRQLGILAMELVSGPAIHGTVYSMDHNVRSEHVFDPSLGEEQTGAYHFVKDKYGDEGSAESDEFCTSIDFAERLTTLTRELESRFGHAIDMEYLVDKNGIIHVVQIRDIARDHKTNWVKYYQQSADDIAATPDVERRAIINSVGVFKGLVVEYEGTLPLAITDDEIQLVRHEFTSEFLERLDRKSIAATADVMIKHGENRIRDHLQYATLEDPAISKVAHIGINDVDTLNTGEVNVYSNGDGFIRLR